MKFFRLFGVISIFIFITLSGCASANNSKPLKLINTINLPDVHGRIDHMDVDTKNNRLFVAALENDSLEIIDMKEGRVLKSIKNLGGPQGVVYSERYSTIYASCRDNGNLVAIDSNNFAQKGKISFSNEADNLHYLKRSNELILGYGNGGIAIINPEDLTVKGKIELDGHPEGFAMEENGNLIYVNVPTSNKLYTINRETLKITEKNNPQGIFSNFPMALIEEKDRLAYYTHEPKQVIFKNIKTGEVIAKYKGPGDIDDMFFDPKTDCLYLIAGEGVVEIVSLDENNKVNLISRTTTGSGARTGFLSSELAQLIVAVPEGNGKNAKILMFSLK